MTYFRIERRVGLPRGGRRGTGVLAAAGVCLFGLSQASAQCTAPSGGTTGAAALAGGGAMGFGAGGGRGGGFGGGGLGGGGGASASGMMMQQAMLAQQMAMQQQAQINQMRAMEAYRRQMAQIQQSAPKLPDDLPQTSPGLRHTRATASPRTGARNYRSQRNRGTTPEAEAQDGGALASIGPAQAPGAAPRKSPSPRRNLR